MRNSGGLGREHDNGDQGSTRVNDILHKFPFSLPYSGYVSRGDGKVYSQGTIGYFWSAGSGSATYARYLDISGRYTNPEASYYKTYGMSVRRDQGSTRANDILHKFPFSLPYSGYVYRTDGKVDNQGTNGDFWLAGSDSATAARTLNYYGNYTSPEYSNYKTHGFSVRCDKGSTRVNDILHKFPFSLPYSRYVDRVSGSTVNQGTDGHWWSAGSYSSRLARSLLIYGNYTYPENDSYKTGGFSVRCVVVKFTTFFSVVIYKISCLSLQS